MLLIGPAARASPKPPVMAAVKRKSTDMLMEVKMTKVLIATAASTKNQVAATVKTAQKSARPDSTEISRTVAAARP